MTETIIAIGYPWYLPFTFAVLGYVAAKVVRWMRR